MRVLCLDLFNPGRELTVQHADSIRHGIAGAAVFSGEENAEGGCDQKADKANDQHQRYHGAAASHHGDDQAPGGGENGAQRSTRCLRSFLDRSLCRLCRLLMPGHLHGRFSGNVCSGRGSMGGGGAHGLFGG